MKRPIAVFSLLVCLFIKIANSQTPYFKLFQFNRENPGIKINLLDIDRNGFLLTGTSEGLYKSDGIDQRIFNTPKPVGNDELSAITTDSLNNIYVGYTNGWVAEIRGNSFQLLSLKKISSRPITSLLYHKSGRLIITTAGDGFYVTGKNGLLHVTEADGLSDNYVYKCITVNQQDFWFATDKGITVFNLGNLALVKTKYNDKNFLNDNIVRDLFKDETGKIWLAMQDSGICYFDPKRSSFFSVAEFNNWKYGQVNSIKVSNNSIWIATEESGLLYYNQIEKRIPQQYKQYENIEFSRVSDLIFDYNGNLWLATNGGLIRSHADWLTFYNRAPQVLFNIHSIYCDRNNNIWFTPDRQLACYSPYSHENADYNYYDIMDNAMHYNITCIQQDKYGYLWISTLGEGILRFDPVHKQVQKFIGSGKVEHSSVLNLKIGNNDSIWIATYGGVLRCKLPPPSNTKMLQMEFEDLSSRPELGNFYINEIFIDSHNRVWFGADSKGLICYENFGYRSFNESHGLISRSVLSITEDIYGNIWCSSLSDGIYRFDGQRFFNYNLENGLRQLKVTSIVADKSGRLVLVHDRGIDVYHIKQNRFEYYGQDNNLNELNPDQNSATTDRFGNIWLGTEKGIIRFNPGYSQYFHNAHIVINRIFKDSVELDKNLPAKLGHSDHSLSFEFAGIWLTDPYRIRYQYKLEGYSDEWITTKDKIVFFASLNPGNYKFKVRASLNNFFDNASEASYSFIILKPFWQELWFIITGALLIFALVYWYVVQREKRLGKLQLAENEKIKFQLQTLKSQVNPHFLFNSFNTLISVIEKNQQSAVEYVQKLSEFFRNMVNYRNIDFISLDEEIAMADVYFYLQQKRYNQNLMMQLNITAEQRKKYGIAPLSVQMLIENAIKHNAVSKETPLLITISVENEMLVISNNINPKLNKEPSSGLGLSNISSRYKLLTGKSIIIEPEADKFIVRIPLVHFK